MVGYFSDWQIEENVEGGSHGLIWDTVLEFVVKAMGNLIQGSWSEQEV